MRIWATPTQRPPRSRHRRARAASGHRVPDACASDAETEALYRFLRNRRVSLDAVIAPHVQATADRCRAIGDVLVLHDTTENVFPGETPRAGLAVLGPRRHGFWLHTALAVSADGLRAPLGVLRLAPFVRQPDPTRVAKPHWRARFRDPQKESRRWADGVTTVRTCLGPEASPIHVMDREGDNYELLAHLQQHHERFVVRLHYDRRLHGGARGRAGHLGGRQAGRRALRTSGDRVGAAGRHAPRPLVKRRPARATRVATVRVAAAAVTLKRPRDHRHPWPASLAVHVVYATEVDPPDGEPPIEWRLVTTEPITTTEQVLRIVEWYRTRWLIEEFFKCLKTGCAYKKRQLESLDTLLVALALLAPIAWQLLLMRHLARERPDVGATVALTQRQIGSSAPRRSADSSPRGPRFVTRCAPSRGSAATCDRRRTRVAGAASRDAETAVHGNRVGGGAGRAHMINHEVREQPHFVLGPKSNCHERGPCGAKRGACSRATREAGRLSSPRASPRTPPAAHQPLQACAPTRARRGRSPRRTIGR